MENIDTTKIDAINRTHLQTISALISSWINANVAMAVCVERLKIHERFVGEIKEQDKYTCHGENIIVVDGEEL